MITKPTTVKTAEAALAALLKQDAELHAKIAKAANGISEAVIRESLTSALRVETSQPAA